jgi:hypothetical protein
MNLEAESVQESGSMMRREKVKWQKKQKNPDQRQGVRFIPESTRYFLQFEEHFIEQLPGKQTYSGTPFDMLGWGIVRLLRMSLQCSWSVVQHGIGVRLHVQSSPHRYNDDQMASLAGKQKR